MQSLHETKPSGRGWALTVNYVAMMCEALVGNMIPVVLTSLSADLGGVHGLTKEQLGRIGGTTFAGIVAGVALTGPLADRWGWKAFAIGGNLLIALGLALLASAPGYGAILAAVFVLGIGGGALDMILSPIVCALQPHRRTTAMNWLHSFYCIGAVATILAASLGLRFGMGWRTLTLALVPAPLLVAAGFIRLRLPPLIQEGQARMRLRRLIRTPYFGVALAAIFLAGATELGMAQWLPAYAEYALGYSKWIGGMALLAFSVGMAAGRVITATLGRRFTAFEMMTFCCWVLVGLYLAGCFLPWKPAALSACVAVGLAASCLWPSMLGLAGDRFPQGGASMFGLLAALGNMGGLFMPWAVGAAADHSSLRLGLSIVALCPLLMALALLWMRRRDPQ